MELVNVLAVDDSKAIRSVIAQQLEFHGFEVETAATKEDALKQIACGRFDVIITDLHMEKSWDGLRLLDIINENHGGPAVIVLSGHQDDAVVSAALEKGAVAFLPKPFKAEDLLLSVTRAAGRRQ